MSSGNVAIEPISTDRAPRAGGHYSQAVKHAGLLYVSGQLPVSPDGTHRPETSFEDQARQAIDNLFGILEAAGSRPENLLKVTVYLVGVDHWGAFDTIYATMLGDTKPARSIVPVVDLHYGYAVEIDAIAAC